MVAIVQIAEIRYFLFFHAICADLYTVKDIAMNRMIYKHGMI